MSGTKNRIAHAKIYDTGTFGVSLSGGDRKNLVSAENVLENSDIFDFAKIEWTYNPAVKFNGVGNIVRKTL